MNIQEYPGTLSFATDAWTSPNHKAYVAITVHFEHKGVPISMLLDLVEVPRSHMGINLAEAFEQVLEEFGISDKVCNGSRICGYNSLNEPDSWGHYGQCIEQ